MDFPCSSSDLGALEIWNDFLAEHPVPPLHFIDRCSPMQDAQKVRGSNEPALFDDLLGDACRSIVNELIVAADETSSRGVQYSDD